MSLIFLQSGWRQHEGRHIVRHQQHTLPNPNFLLFEPQLTICRNLLFLKSSDHVTSTCYHGQIKPRGPIRTNSPNCLESQWIAVRLSQFKQEDASQPQSQHCPTPVRANLNLHAIWGPRKSQPSPQHPPVWHHRTEVRNFCSSAFPSFLSGVFFWNLFSHKVHHLLYISTHCVPFPEFLWVRVDQNEI